MKVNGKIVSDLHDKWNKYFIVVGEKDLKEGKNKISILFENDYAKDGDGLHSMMDTDGL
jgi:threonyl-tRNA synthetase